MIFGQKKGQGRAFSVLQMTATALGAVALGPVLHSGLGLAGRCV